MGNEFVRNEFADCGKNRINQVDIKTGIHELKNKKCLLSVHESLMWAFHQNITDSSMKLCHLLIIFYASI